ncbi:hypothetical protein ACJIZ3_012536 [Penstemon smallii]|uniref:Membrane transporter protein n=1 Tax=Penstemon smallii TaxID=265156 RepID=A0ABD3UMB0_9LAMI
MINNLKILLAGILTFTAAAISSAGGTGGGGLFIPILTIVAGVDLRTASSFSAFMVTGGSIANVFRYMFAKHKLIDYDITLLSEPCMLLGVSIGVICNRVLPEWLITTFFAVFLGFSSLKTCNSGVSCWKKETQRKGSLRGSNGEPLLLSSEIEEVVFEEEEDKIPWVKVGMLVVIWFAFTLVYLFRGNKYGQGIIHIKACGKLYWIISSVQIPLTIIFTTWILCTKKNLNKDASSDHLQVQEINDEVESRNGSSDNFIFPSMALLTGILGGLFGVGGGMLISPLLLQMGIEPEVTAATCSFMVFFSSSMSAIQYLLLGMDHIYNALAFAVICFVGSIVGQTLVHRAIMKHGRASLIVFSVGIVMVLSTVLITSFGAVDVWRTYKTGQSMGFSKPC